ncbi:MFS transporter [Pseudonocardia cypriaca]|uniref:MFS transporter n=1 Tax=Pseudonocardia cypriaca TaxID=882449 RepID=A0A543FSQ5_9PSEU|nr:MFS transporter [Pseudonocardia cypriaca]
MVAAVAGAPLVAFAAFPMPIPALPAISAELGVGTAELQLLVSGYALGLGTLLVLAGVLADRSGAVRVWVVAMSAFGVCSLGCAVAPAVPALIAGRIGQGVAGAGLLAASLALVATAVPAPRRPGAAALWGAAIGAGLAGGPLVGGVSLEFGQWRPVFAGLGLLALLAAGAGWLLLPAVVPAGGSAARLEPFGPLTLAGGLAALILAVNWAGAGDWTAPRVLGGLLVAAALLGCFALVQRRAPEPMLDLAVLRNRQYLGGLVAGLALALSALSMMVVIGPYLQVVVGASALVLALWFLPFSGLAFAVALLAARLSPRLSLRARLVAGLGAAAAGMAALLPIAPGWTWPALVPGMALTGVGVGLANPALAIAAVGSVPPERSGMAAGVANTARQMGNALGIVVLAMAMQVAAIGAARAAGAGVDAAVLIRIAGGDLPGARALSPDPELVTRLYAAAQTSGVRVALLVAIATCLAGLLATAWLMRPDRRPDRS